MRQKHIEMKGGRAGQEETCGGGTFSSPPTAHFQTLELARKYLHRTGGKPNASPAFYYISGGWRPVWVVAMEGDNNNNKKKKVKGSVRQRVRR